MNWEAIGAVGEVLGALGVIITLLYLAVQIRQNSALAKAQINAQGLESFSRYRQMAIEHADVLAKSRNGESLSEEEEVVVEVLASEIMFNFASLIRSSSVVDPGRVEELYEGACAAVSASSRNWNTVKAQLARNGFGDIVDEIDSRLKTSAL